MAEQTLTRDARRIATSKAYYLKHREKRLKTALEWQRTNADLYRRNQARYRRENAEKIKAYKLANRTENNKKAAERQLMQRLSRPSARPRPNACEACGRECLPCWDHDHATGTFRGWLCRACNSALGFVSDNVTVLNALAAYVARSREKV